MQLLTSANVVLPSGSTSRTTIAGERGCVPEVSIKIRSYRDTDEDPVVLLWSVIFRDDPPWNEPREVIRRKLGVQPGLFLVAAEGESIVGTALAGFDGCRGWVHHVAVDPGYRRAGVGSLLMHAAESGLLAAGCPKLNLQVRGSNTAVVSFYESLGYAVEERISMGKLLGEKWTRPESVSGGAMERRSRNG